MTTTVVGRFVVAILLGCLAGCAGVTPGGPTANAVPSTALVATVPAGRPPTLLAISGDGAHVFAASGGTLSIIATDTNTVTTTARTGPYPSGIAATPDGRSVLLTSLQAARLTVVDVPSGRVSSIGLIVDMHPGGFGRIAVARDGSRAFVTNEGREYLAIVDLAARQTTEMSLDMRPSDVTFGPGDGTLYVTGCKDFCTTGTVEVIDPASGKQKGDFAVGGAPYRFALSPDGTRAYTTNLADGSLTIVDVASGRQLAKLSTGVEPAGLAVSPDGTRVYVASQAADTLTIVDAATNSVARTLAIPNGPREIVLSPDGRRAYVSTRESVVVLDTGRM